MSIAFLIAELTNLQNTLFILHFLVELFLLKFVAFSPSLPKSTVYSLKHFNKTKSPVSCGAGVGVGVGIQLETCLGKCAVNARYPPGIKNCRGVTILKTFFGDLC